ncbi:MAG TPA: lysophospholipid acyltransferase family protein [Thermoanaerobaculia bacterium]|nr:lysophospholipid acyltransferase family protein [Thermoanaerobaculia bacterium]
MSRRRKSAVVQRSEYVLYRAVAWFARRLSDRAVLRWGDRLGNIARRILRKRDRLAMRNLRETLRDKPEHELRAILDSCWRHFGREALLSLRAQEMTLDEIAPHVAMVNQEVLEESIARGKGTILISAHYGGWEIAGLAVMSIVNNVRTITRPLDNEFLERDLARFRSRTGAAVLDRRRAAREIIRALSENAVVVLLPDQAVLPREGILSPFLGRPAWTTPVPAKMAVRRGSSIVFTFCIPHGSEHRLEFGDPIRVDELTEAECDPVVLTRRINDVISARIAAHPELWLWMHDRWKGTATGESEGANGE